MSLIESITVKNLDHLGIVAGLIDEIGIKEINKQSIFYHYQIETKPRVSEIERRTVAAGRFILATNIESSSDLHCSEILWNYKNPN